MRKGLIKTKSEEYVNSEIRLRSITVIGLGSVGCKMLEYIYRKGLTDLHYLMYYADMDRYYENSSFADEIYMDPHGLIGGSGKIGRGLDAFRRMVQKQEETIKKVIPDDTKLLIVVAAMGGITGTGAAPVVAEIAKSITDDNAKTKMYVAAVVTMPFLFEGLHIRRYAEEGLQELKKHVDSITIIDNEEVFKKFPGTSRLKVFSKVDEMVFEAIKSMIETFKG